MNRSVWVVTYSHRHGEDRSYWATPALAAHAAARIAIEWFGDVRDAMNDACMYCEQSRAEHADEKCLFDRTDFRSVAYAFLDAYEQKKYDRVVSLYTEYNPDESLGYEEVYVATERDPKDEPAINALRKELDDESLDR